MSVINNFSDVGMFNQKISGSDALIEAVHAAVTNADPRDDFEFSHTTKEMMFCT